MPVPDQEQIRRWRERRATRRQAIPWLRLEPARPTAHAPAVYVADELLVRDDHQAAGENIISELGHRRAAITTDEPMPGFRRLTVPGLDALTAARTLRAQVPDGGTIVGVNHVFLSSPFEHGGPYGPPSPFGTPAPTLHTPSATAVRVGVLDTGVWADSPLPSSSYHASPGDFETTLDVDTDGEIDSDVGHANFIAGVLLNRSGNASVRIVKVLDTLGICTELDLANALLTLTDVDVINLSLGGFTVDDQPPAALQFALQTVLSGADRVTVAAAGNDGQAGRAFWPAAFSTGGHPWSDQVIAVAAHDGSAVCPWSNTGPWVTLAAPGSDVTSTYVNHTPFGTGWARWSGTSFAAPYVAAAIAEQVPASGSVLAASQHVRKLATMQTFGSCPVLP